jgi:hypothetical protein
MGSLAYYIASFATWAPDNARNDIQPGHYLIRLVKKGPLVAARIYWCDHEPGNEENKLDRWPIPFLMGEIAGEAVDALGIWLARGRQEITAAEYRYRSTDAAWAREHSPLEPAANPRKKIDQLQAPLPF